jgi:hypothetical protein
MGLLLVFVIGGLAIWQALIVWPHTYSFDLDSLLRMQQVMDLINGQAWYDHIQHRLNPPIGVFIHWTKPVDMLLLLIALPLSHFMSVKTAVLVSAAFVPLFFMMVSGCLLIAAVRPLRVSGVTHIYLLFVCAATPCLWGVYTPFAVDHHFLLTTLSIAVLALGVHLLTAEQQALKKHSLLLGAVIGLGIWVSPEFLVFSGICLGYLGCCWVGNPERYRFVLPDVLKTTTFVLCLAVLWERRPLLAVEHDTVSVVHVTLFALLTLLALLLRRFHVLHSGMARFQGAALGGILVLGVMELVFTGFHRAHYNHVSAFVDKNLLADITELQPLLESQAKNLLVFVAYIYVFVVGFAGFFSTRVRAVWRAQPAPYFFLFVTAIGMLYMALLQQRWIAYAIAPMALMSVAVVKVLLDDADVFMRRLSLRTRLDVRFLTANLLAIFLAAGGLGSAMLGVALEKPDTTQKIQLKKEQKACAAAMGKFMRDGEMSAVLKKPSGLVLAPTDWAPQILFWTPHKAVAGNYHRDTDGIKAVIDFFSVKTAAAAQAIVVKHNVDMVVYCENEGLLNRVESLKSPFFKNIHEGKGEPWFDIVPMPQDPHLKILLIKAK